MTDKHGLYPRPLRSRRTLR